MNFKCVRKRQKRTYILESQRTNSTNAAFGMPIMNVAGYEYIEIKFYLSKLAIQKPV